MRLPTSKQWRAYYLCVVMGNKQREAGSAMGVSQPMVSSHLAAVRAKIPLISRADSAVNITMPRFISYDPSMDYSVRHQF